MFTKKYKYSWSGDSEKDKTLVQNIRTCIADAIKRNSIFNGMQIQNMMRQQYKRDLEEGENV